MHLCLDATKDDGEASRYGASGERLLTQAEMDDGWSKFQQLRDDQSRWRHDVQSVLFKEHFAMLPNVIEAEVITAELMKGHINTWPLWKRLRNSILIDPSSLGRRKLPRASAEGDN